MTDIVERLRERAEQEHEMLGDIHLPLLEAAAEIEKLRAALRDLLRLVDEDPEEDDPSPYLFDQVCDRARAAIAKAEKERT